MTLIQKDTVNNGAETTNITTNPYACPNTPDHVFALSYQELISDGYNFPTNTNETTTRMLANTAYSTATGTSTWSLESLLAETENEGFSDVLDYLKDEDVGYAWSAEFAQNVYNYFNFLYHR